MSIMPKGSHSSQSPLALQAREKNEKIPLVHVEPLVQMAKHSNTVEGGKRHQNCKEGEKLYKRKKEICPLCDKVSMYLTTHLQRVHKLKTKSSQYEKALLTTRYRGKAAELLWDSDLINRKRKAKGKPAPNPLKRKLPTIYSSSSEEDDQPHDLKKLKFRGVQNQGKTRFLHQNKTIQKLKMKRNFSKKMNPSGKNVLVKMTMKSGKARAATLRWN